MIFTFKNSTDWLSLIKTAVISPETAKSLRVNKELPTDENFSRAVQNTKGARVTEDGLEIEVIRNQHPDQGETDSVRSGVFYQPSGSTNKYPYSGKGGYGGTERIQGTTLLRRPIFVKGATGGKAPQMAYDLIKGKGSYEKMRDDVLKKTLSIHWGSKRPMIDIIQELLRSYGGETDLAGTIEDFSRNTKGNNLAYAIQENIVASTVRTSGYDSVVGWSSKRDGTPFLSEVFDVREVTYPSRWKPEGQVHQTLLVKKDIQQETL